MSIYILFFLPIILIILFQIFKSSKKVVQNVNNELFGPVKGKYNLKKIDLLNYVTKSKTFKLYIQFRILGSDRYIMLRHLSETSYDISSTKSTYIVIPHNLDRKIKSVFPLIYQDEKIENKKLNDILKFILNQCDIISYTEYPKDSTSHYYLAFKEIESKNCSDEYISKIFSVVKNYYDIYYEYSVTEHKHQGDFIKLLNEKNWSYSQLKIPRQWQYEFDSRKWNNAVDWFYQID